MVDPFTLSRYDVHDWLATGHLDDSTKHIATTAAVATKRAECNAWLWGSDGVTTDEPTVTEDVEAPLELTGCTQVDQLDYTVTGEEAYPLLAYHYHPTTPNGKCLIVGHGHGHYTQGSGGLSNLMQAAITVNFGVIATHLPGQYTGHTGGHAAICTETEWSATAGSPLRTFLALQVAAMNLLGTTYSSFYVSGLSGGGCCAALLGALDTRILKTYPIAGIQPLYMRTDGSASPLDPEQAWPRFYEMSGGLDILLMAAYQRRLVLIYNDGDNCCFGPDQYSDTGAGARIVGLTYEEALDDMLAELRGVVGTPAVDWWLDMTSTTHECTAWAAAAIIADIG